MGVRDTLPPFSDPLPPELSFHDDSLADGTTTRSAGSVSVEDYDRIARCMEISGATWLQVAERGQRAGVIHWKVAGICRTLAGYAGGWERKPSAKQAKPALEALMSVQQADLLPGTAVAK